jgi:hypothetical protein
MHAGVPLKRLVVMFVVMMCVEVEVLMHVEIKVKLTRGG